ncbi:MAG: ABC transporter substrate-binding protein [Bacteroidales bacterium]|nr:ABC transporter substrate-binding protein [Candidatus Cryptobacteroides caccocaballi]
MKYFRLIMPLIAAFFFFACSAPEARHLSDSARYFSVTDGPAGVVVRISSPFDGTTDSLVVSDPMKSIVCMSTTMVAAFEQLGRTDVVTGVSGKNYVTDPRISENPYVAEVGFDSALDYETMLSLNPDLVLAYAVSSVEPPYVQKLRSLGVKVLMVYDNFESHPLARAEYIRLCAALTAERDKADSIYASVSSSYYKAMDDVRSNDVKVMINAPYGDAWYVPGKDSYMSRLVSDAGGVLLGSEDGLESSLISLETAYGFSREADVWLNPGIADIKETLIAMHPLFIEFCRDGLRIYNNTLRKNSEGGNDFYESGAMRPDLILKDLISIFSGNASDLEYHIEVE